jgi:hypothetical protein
MNMTDSGTVALLDADPDLGQLLGPDRLQDARRQLRVRRHVVEPGPWDGERFSDAGPEHLGLLLIDGAMTRELIVADNVSAELLGPGDIVRPWQAGGPEHLVPFEIRWTAVERTEFGVLDRHFAALLSRFPAVNAMIVERMAERTQRLALLQAVSQLNGIDRRLLTLFWHLAERWGRVTSKGVLIPVPMPHRVLAQLVGARRPTVSSALRRLIESGELARELDGSWRLTGSPVGMPSGSATRVVRLRRFRVPAVPSPPIDEQLQARRERRAGGRS